MSYIGHPLLGDGKYGKNREDKKAGYKYQALYSYKLIFENGIGSLEYLTGKTVVADMKNVWFAKEFK